MDKDMLLQAIVAAHKNESRGVVQGSRGKNTARNALIAEAYKAGVSQLELARLLGISQPSISVILRRAGVKKGVPEERVRRNRSIVAMHKRGVPVSKIAAKVGLSENYVRLIIATPAP